MTTHADIHAHRVSGKWRALERVAQDIVRDACDRAGAAMQPLLGGGTRLMLAMEHRMSDDIDLFIRDPQWLGFITPRLNDRFEHLISAYDEGATSLKLRFPEGEIDFIVGMSLLGKAEERINDCAFALEPVSEVLAKKLFYRGWALTPRDLFDWWSIHQFGGELNVHRDELARLIVPRADTLSAALTAMKSSQSARAVWESIRSPDLPNFDHCILWASREVEALKSIEKNQHLARGNGVGR